MYLIKKKTHCMVEGDARWGCYSCNRSYLLSESPSFPRRFPETQWQEDTGSDIYNLNQVDFSTEQRQFCVSQHVSTGPAAFIQLSVPVRNQCFTVSGGPDDSDWALEQKAVMCERWEEWTCVHNTCKFKNSHIMFIIVRVKRMSLDRWWVRWRSNSRLT